MLSLSRSGISETVSESQESAASATNCWSTVSPSASRPIYRSVYSILRDRGRIHAVSGGREEEKDAGPSERLPVGNPSVRNLGGTGTRSAASPPPFPQRAVAAGAAGAA